MKKFEDRDCKRCNGTGRLFDDVALGAAMREDREKLKLSLRSVADQMGVSAAYVSDLEKGKRTWKKSRLDEYRKALKSLAAK